MSNNDVSQEGVATPERPEWFYELNGSRVGPATSTKISELLVQGTLTNKTLVWKSAFGPEWRQIDATDLLQIGTTTPPPLPQSHINDFYARGLILVPLIGVGFEGFLRNVFSHVPDIAIFCFYFIANTALSITDSKQISKSGRNPNNLLLGFWFWLIPVPASKDSRTKTNLCFLLDSCSGRRHFSLKTRSIFRQHLLGFWRPILRQRIHEKQRERYLC